ncbi:MAG: ISAs1 family transposase [Proteobacteria bacterium]|nr:ISAs1 family transposase [Pseudomonadota bacterium]
MATGNSRCLSDQKEIVSKIIDKQCDYVISLKGNQGTLHQDVVEYFNNPKLIQNCLFSEENDKGHGRLEQRKAYSCANVDWLQQPNLWPGLRSIGMVATIVEKKA